MIIGCVLRTAGSSIIWNYADPLTSIELLNYYLTLAMTYFSNDGQDLGEGSEKDVGGVNTFSAQSLC